MEKLTLLENKIKELAKEHLNLKEENEKLKADLKYLKSENDGKKIKEVKIENEDFKVQKTQIAERLNKLIDRFSRAGI